MIFSGTPSLYDEYFEIDPVSGRVKQLKALDRKLAKVLNIIVKVSKMSISF